MAVTGVQTCALPISDNIRLGKPGASLADIAAVAEQAGVAEIIARLDRKSVV